VNVLIQDQTGQRLQRGKPEWGTMKVVRREGSLLPMSTTLSLLTRRNGIEGGTNHLQVDGHQLLFRVAEDVELAIVSIADFDKLSTKFPGTALHITQAIIRSFYFVVFPICRSYFGLHSEVLACERAISRESLSSSSFPLEPMVAWLREVRNSQIDTSDLGLKKGIVLQDGNSEIPSPIALVQSPNGSIISMPEIVETQLHVRSPSPRRSITRARSLAPPSLRLEIPSASPEIGNHDDSYLRSPSVLSRTEENPFVRRPSNNFRWPREPVSIASGFLRQEIFHQILFTLDIEVDHNEPNEIRKPNFSKSDFTFAQGAHRIREGRASLLMDYRHDIKVVYFPEGSILVHEGERYPGIYYVLDGRLKAQPIGGATNDNNDGWEEVFHLYLALRVKELKQSADSRHFFLYRRGRNYWIQWSTGKQ